MANLKEIRNRIASVGSTMQITSAMKMVSAAKLKRAQDAITQMRPYSEKLQEILQNVSSTLDLSENGYSEVRAVKNVLIIAITSNRGLCGGFNNNIIKKVNNLLVTEYADKNVTVLPIGKKIFDVVKRSNQVVTTASLGIDDFFADFTFKNASVIAEYAMEGFTSGKYDKVVIVYNRFVNAATQIVMNEQFLPIAQSENAQETNAADYIYEPSKAEIVEDLIPKSLKTQLYKALLDSHASEHGARMIAMNKATDNAKELKKTLTISYNKARQAAITNEILEIVGGAEALNN
ncbi:MAG: ATP synthase F1 subunit gamma [Flavobacteriia bacterium]|nr:ATP synthase F1 subunit gamma [Flavobacteriia bacterium]OJX36760.1 MAG: ATP synthase F1 subunit gamma [Flavobacteriia bacterium 40-80]